MNDVIKVAERLYYEANPTTKMDVPSFAYEQVEKANHRRLASNSELSLYDWCKQEQAIKVKSKLTEEEELKTVDPKLIEAFEKLSEEDKIKLQRGYKTWKTNGKSEYVLVDNYPGFLKPRRGTNLTPKKKKRKKR